MSRKTLSALAALLVAIGTLLGALVNPDETTQTSTVTRTVEAKVTPAQEAEIVQEAPPSGDLAAPEPDGATATEDPSDSDLRDETPPGIPQDKLEQAADASDQAADAVNVSDEPLPAGGAQNYRVIRDFSGHVYSDFTPGVTPSMFCLHYTVSGNVTGWGDVRGVQGYFIRTRVGSSTFIADFEAHILQMVPLTNKAWTQGSFNPNCRASVEIIATGKESRAQWLASRLIKGKVLAQLMLDTMRKYRLPIRFVDPVGCTAIPGYTDHHHLECGNSHTDVAPTFPFDVLARQLRELNDPCGKTCRKVRPRHKVIHKQLGTRCDTPRESRKVRPKECRRLRGRNLYIHRVARKRGFTLPR